MSGPLGAGILDLFGGVGEQYGIPRTELFRAAGLEANDARAPRGFVSRATVESLIRALHQRTGDPALGLRLARSFDIRALGFWGYALLSCLTIRQRLHLQLHYYKYFHPEAEFSFRVVGDRAIVDAIPHDVAPDILAIMMDFLVTISAIQFGKHTGSAKPEIELWLMHPEAPHHAELRALVTGPVIFDAPHYRSQAAARELDRRLAGDPYLLELARAQLESQLASVKAVFTGGLLEEVRQRVAVRLAKDASLERIAGDLRVSVRTLRRRLTSAGASFQDLLEETRRSRAIQYLVETDESVEQIAERLGYSDPANFRRAFRRWTGVAPGAFRREKAAGASPLADEDLR